jgi:type II secretion system protein D
MPLSFQFLRELFLVTAAFVAVAALEIPASAQDTGPVSPGTTSYQNAPVNTILDLYEQLTGKHLIRDANLSGVNPISLNISGLSKAETIKMIEQFLLLNGVAFIPVDDETMKVITVGTNKQPRSEGIEIYTSAADLPKTEEIVTYYMPLDYINPQEAAGIFSQVAPPHQYGNYTPAPSAQAVIITENVSVIRQLIALKAKIDAAPAKVSGEWIQINRADAEKVSDTLNKMLGQASTSGTAGAAPAPVPGAGPGNGVMVPADIGNDSPMSNERNLISGPAQIIPDPRSNRIWVSTRPVNMPFLEQMIAQLDQPDSFQIPQRKDLHYVSAADILPALEAAVAQGKDEEDQLKKDEQAAQTTNQTGNRNGTTGGTTSTPTSTAGTSSGGSGTVSAVTPQLSAPTENDVPTVITIGKTRLMADNRSNSIIVFGSIDVVNRVFDMVDQLDRKPLQVYLATVIGELTVSQGMEFGIDLLQKFSGNRTGIATSNLNSSQAGTSNSTGNGSPFLPEPSTLTSALGFPVPTGLTLYGAIGNTIDAYLRALETTDRFKIISRPSVYTTNNTLAVIASGSQVPVPSSTTAGFTGTTTDSLTTTSSIAYEDVLLQLDIVPLINAKHEVTLKIRQTNNSLGNNIDISGNEIPIINTQEINTEVTVPNKSTVVIGGLITDNTTRNGSGIPFLSDIPVLGYLFSDTKKTKERDELIIMIQPSVVETDADQIAVNEEEKQRTILGREAVQAAQGAPVESDNFQLAPTPEVSAPRPLEEQPAPGTVQQVDTKSTTTHNGPYNSKAGTSTTTTTTTTTTVSKIPGSTSVMTPLGPTTPTGPVPAASTPAPDVQNGRMPSINPPPPPLTSPGGQ